MFCSQSWCSVSEQLWIAANSSIPSFILHSGASCCQHGTALLTLLCHRSDTHRDVESKTSFLLGSQFSAATAWNNDNGPPVVTRTMRAAPTTTTTATASATTATTTATAAATTATATGVPTSPSNSGVKMKTVERKEETPVSKQWTHVVTPYAIFEEGTNSVPACQSPPCLLSSLHGTGVLGVEQRVQATGPGQAEITSSDIGVLWNALTTPQKAVYNKRAQQASYQGHYQHSHHPWLLACLRALVR